MVILYIFISAICFIAVILIFVSIHNRKREKRRNELLREILTELHLGNIDSVLYKYDDRIIVKSRQALNNYTDIKYIKDKSAFDQIRKRLDARQRIKDALANFLNENNYEDRKEYSFVKGELEEYISLASSYRVLVKYVTYAGNTLGRKVIYIKPYRMVELLEHPEYMMTKGEYNKFVKQVNQEKLDERKHSFYNRVNYIIDYANTARETLIIKGKINDIDDLVQKLFNDTVNHIQKITKLESDEWDMISRFITTIYQQIREIVEKDAQISAYYESNDFTKVKEACDLLMQSQREFNEYIDEKAKSIVNLFGIRVIRNETHNDDIYNYVRAYKKSISPFTAEVSASVFGSAENNPIGYIVKCFYPNKEQYKFQIEKLKILIEELETLKEAKQIIDEYKKEYEQYISNVPTYVLDNDETGFYSRLGFPTIDDSVLNVEYRFTYTSNGGMAQRSFSVPMTEENISELINLLESKLSIQALAKEQRALMTTRLRIHIKERDNYTCCQCGNSTQVEPNLLLEIDHIIPISKGGLTKEDNLQTLCWKCNRNKGAKIVY